MYRVFGGSLRTVATFVKHVRCPRRHSIPRSQFTRVQKCSTKNCYILLLDSFTSCI